MNYTLLLRQFAPDLGKLLLALSAPGSIYLFPPVFSPFTVIGILISLLSLDQAICTVFVSCSRNAACCLNSCKLLVLTYDGKDQSTGLLHRCQGQREALAASALPRQKRASSTEDEDSLSCLQTVKREESSPELGQGSQTHRWWALWWHTEPVLATESRGRWDFLWMLLEIRILVGAQGNAPLQLLFSNAKPPLNP